MPSGQDWGLSDLYIGPACPENCGGQGQCLMEACLCDDDFTGDACEIALPGKVKVSPKITCLCT